MLRAASRSPVRTLLPLPSSVFADAASARRRGRKFLVVQQASLDRSFSAVISGKSQTALSLRADGPDLFGKQGTLLSNKAALIPGFADQCDSGKLDSRLDLPTIQPSSPNINTALTTNYCPKFDASIAVGVSPSFSAQASRRFEHTFPNVCSPVNVCFPC